MVAIAWLFGTVLMLIRVFLYTSRDFIRQCGLAKGRCELPLVLKYIVPHYPLENGRVEFSLSVKIAVAFVNAVFNLVVGILISVFYPIYIIFAIGWGIDLIYLAARRRLKERETPANIRSVALMLQGLDGNGKVDRKLYYERMLVEGAVLRDADLDVLYQCMIESVDPSVVPKILRPEYSTIMRYYEKKREKEEGYHPTSKK